MPKSWPSSTTRTQGLLKGWRWRSFATSLRTYRSIASTLAFKYARVENQNEVAASSGLTFKTSGTTKGFTARGMHRVPYPEIYRASAIAHLRRMLFPDDRRMPLIALHPTADRMPE